MANLKKKIIKALYEGVVGPEDLQQNIDDLVKTAKTELDVDDAQAKDFVSGIVGEEEIEEKAKSKSQQRFMGMVYNCKKTGDCPSASVRKAADSMKLGDVEDFASTKHKGLPNEVEENDVDNREVEYGINSEVGGDKYDEYRALMQQLAAEEGEGAVRESVKGKMTKNQLIETVTGKKPRKVIKTVKVKDIK